MTEFGATTAAKYKIYPDLWVKHALGGTQAAQLKIAELRFELPPKRQNLQFASSQLYCLNCYYNTMKN